MSEIATATMIGSAEDQNAPLFRTEFTLTGGHGAVVSAELQVSAQGIFQAYLGGSVVGGDVLSPGWSSYEWRLRYSRFDVTERIAGDSGQVVLGIALGNGWFRGRLGWSGARAVYGDRLGAVAALTIKFEDGHRQVVRTDESWRSGPSAVVADDLYDGQTVDARLVSDAWLRPGFADLAWSGVSARSFDAGRLVPYLGPPVVRHEEIRPVKVWASPAGKTLIDFGQNLVGWLKFSIIGNRDEVIMLRHAEVLENGELGVRPLRSAKATDALILSGGEDFFEPTFTFHGFRYAEVTGWPGELTPDSLVAVVISSQLELTGTFECSNPELNQLHRNVVWGLRGNFVDVPTDCPQRDERLGWTGDLAVFAPTAAYLYDVKGFFREWLANLDVEQAARDGLVPRVVPDPLKYTEASTGLPAPESTAIWGDAAVWVPWALWQAYGDQAVLEDAYPATKAHVRRVESLLSPTGLWDTGFQFGDWLDPTAPPEDPGAAKADTGVVATACLYRSAVMTAEIARILGHAEDVDRFAELASRTRTVFSKHYVTAEGVVRSDCPTVYTLAIVFGLLDEPQRQLAGDRLAELVAANGYRIATGFAGTPYIADALTMTGHLEDAYRLLLEHECPSWLYSVAMGATTIWERWDSMLPDGTINPGEMTSFNHYALGAVADWMHRIIGGIAPDTPGYQRVRIAPRPGGGIGWAKSSLRTRYGDVRVSWGLVDGELSLDVDLPEGLTADIELPGLDIETVAGGQTVHRSTTSKAMNA